jgi:type I restriction enzyme, R subunit
MSQSEAALENKLISQLGSMGYSKVVINDEASMVKNLQFQLEKHNKTSFSESEFSRVLNILNKGTVLDRAKTLRGQQRIEGDDGKSKYFYFLNSEEWCKNEFQVTNQITIKGSYENRYDVTILINGLPLVHIELKRRGIEISKALNQLHRYKRHSFSSGYGLFEYVQIFIISNGSNTKYLVNNNVKLLNSEQTFFWADKDNNKITDLSRFAESFLEPCHISKMICRYIVIAETDRMLMVLRPYQYYAVEKIIERVKNTDKNGYIWHTTGSGKTLTSFKASQLIMNLPEVHKVVFVVDRRDLDYQTNVEFNKFSKGSVDGTNNTASLVKQFGDDTKLLVTTIQKLNNAIGSQRYEDTMADLKDKKIVFIFDECHRSQFGETHKRIKKFFNNHQMFGFTGTPIFAENAVKNQLGKRTTSELFGDCLHKYVITDAIKDQNVLRFSVEYIGKYKQRKESSLNSVDIKVEGIDTTELLESEDRLEKITNYIIHNHNTKTHRREFTGMFCVSNVKTLIRYYEMFRKKKNEGKHNLNIATIFSFAPNEKDDTVTGWIGFDDEDKDVEISKDSREKLDEFIGDYNKTFGTKYSTKDSKSFYNYYNEIAKRVKEREIDILLVVNMFLTGFDSKFLNTLYVDKNLRHHGLIQAYSRTNRTINKKKSHGNIVAFRNLKKATDEAISLFSNKDANEVILMKPYNECIDDFSEALKKLKQIAPNLKAIDEFVSEDDIAEFVRAFRELMRAKNTLTCFADFSYNDLGISEDEFDNYKSKYLDIYESTKISRNKDSILDDVDFEVELLRRDLINVSYILKLLSNLVKLDSKDATKKRKQINDLIDGDLNLRSKKELIEKFIDENLSDIKESDDIEKEFDNFMNKEKIIAFNKLCQEENLDTNKMQNILDEYVFSGKLINMNDKVDKSLNVREPLFKRQVTIERVIDKVESLISKFFEDIAA